VSTRSSSAKPASDRDAVARGVERPARLGRHQLQRVEAEQHAIAQAIHAADHRRIDQPEADHPLGIGKYLGAGRTGRGNREAWAFQLQRLSDESRQRMRFVDRRPQHVIRKAAIGIEPAIGLLGGADAGGGRAQQQRDAAGAIAFARGPDPVEETILIQAQPGQPIVAAFPDRMGGRQGSVFHAVNAANPARQWRDAEIVWAQATAGLTQCFEVGRKTVADGRAGGIRRDRERCHRNRHHQSLAVTLQLA
jgi:hypothetical protein